MAVNATLDDVQWITYFINIVCESHGVSGCFDGFSGDVRMMWQVPCIWRVPFGTGCCVGDVTRPAVRQDGAGSVRVMR